MSRYVWLSCKNPECQADSYSDSLNRGEERLREMWTTRALVAALYETRVWEAPGVFEGHGDWFGWIARHATHQVELHDDGGGVASVDGTARCERPVST
jgi:hypothetical protein